MTLRRLIGLAALLSISPASAKTPSDYQVAKTCAAKTERCFTSIVAALDTAARDPGKGFVTIRIAPGDYREKPVITRDRIRLIGGGADKTRIVFGAVAQTAKAYHRAGWGTAGSATLTIDAKDVRVSGLTIENDFDYLANDAIAYGNPERIGNPQAVALLLDIHSDHVLLDRVSLLGFQDTLFTNAGRSIIRKSLIAGNIDFIFGNGQLLIEDSEIRTRRRAAPYVAGDFQSFIAAPSTPLAQSHGIIFYRARLTREEGVPDGAVALARPWHPTTKFPDGRYADPKAIGQAIFIDCFMDRHIHPDHWTSMNGTARDGTATSVFRPQDSRFFESGSYGPGAQARDIGMTWRSDRSIAQIRRDFTAGWSL